jgi:hypothetical protein
MKPLLSKFTATALLACFCGGCATQGPPLAWGKPGVSRTEYGNDVGMCSSLAVMEKTGTEINKAGGIQGKNNAPEMGTDGSSGQPQPPPGATDQAVPAPMPASGSFSGMASADFAQRAAAAQTAQEMQAKRAKAEALRSCLTVRGYRQFALSPEQRAHLAALPKGSEEHLEYLYTLGSNVEVVNKQAVAQ